MENSLTKAKFEGQNYYLKKYIYISNLVNVLTIFYIHFATHLMNKSVSFHGKHEIVWVTIQAIQSAMGLILGFGIRKALALICTTSRSSNRIQLPIKTYC